MLLNIVLYKVEYSGSFHETQVSGTGLVILFFLLYHWIDVSCVQILWENSSFQLFVRMCYVISYVVYNILPLANLNS